MKEKILIALKTKYKNLGFGDKAFDGVAAFLATTITEEENIETGIAGVEGLFKGFQGDVDKRVTDAVSKTKLEAATNTKKESTTKSGGDEPDTTKKDEDGIPAWAQSLLDANKALSGEIATLKSGKTAESRKAILETKLKDAQPKFKEKILKDFSRMQFEKDEDFDAYVTETETDLSEFTQSLSDQGLGSQKPPTIAGGNLTKTALEADIKGWAAATEPAKAV
jgi:hypothetical protein